LIRPKVQCQAIPQKNKMDKTTMSSMSTTPYRLSVIDGRYQITASFHSEVSCSVFITGFLAFD